MNDSDAVPGVAVKGSVLELEAHGEDVMLPTEHLK